MAPSAATLALAAFAVAAAVVVLVAVVGSFVGSSAVSNDDAVGVSRAAIVLNIFAAVAASLFLFAAVVALAVVVRRYEGAAAMLRVVGACRGDRGSIGCRRAVDSFVAQPRNGYASATPWAQASGYWDGKAFDSPKWDTAQRLKRTTAA